MANHDQTPRRSPVERHLTDPQVEHEMKLLDTDSINATPTPVGELGGIHDAQALRDARIAYDQKVRDAFAGRVGPDQSASGTRYVAPELLDTAGLFETYKHIYPDLVPTRKGRPSFPGAHGRPPGQQGIFFDKNSPVGSYASLIVGNNPNPAVLLAKMHDRFAMDHPDVAPDVQETFNKALENLARTLYGQRYDEYERQCDDLGLVPSEVMRDKADQQVRENDVMILGRSFGVRRKIGQIAHTQQNRLARFTSGTHRLLVAKPALAWHGRRLKSAQHRLDRKQDKMDRANTKLERSAILSPAVKEAIRKERQAKLGKHVEKVTTITSQRESQEKKIRESRGDLAAKIELNHRTYREKVEGYKTRHQAALANKLLRRELKLSGLDSDEKAKILADISPEQLQRIGRVIALEAGARRDVSDLSHDHSQSTSEVAHLEQLVADNTTEIRACESRILGLSKACEALRRDKIVPAQEELNKKEEALKQASQDHTLPLERFEEMLADFKKSGNRLDNLKGMHENALTQIQKLTQRVTHLQGLKPDLEKNLRDAEAQATKVKQALDASRREQSIRAEAVSRVAAENITPKDKQQ